MSAAPKPPQWVGFTGHIDNLNELKPYMLLLDTIVAQRIFEEYLLGMKSSESNWGLIRSNVKRSLHS